AGGDRQVLRVRRRCRAKYGGEKGERPDDELHQILLGVFDSPPILTPNQRPASVHLDCATMGISEIDLKFIASMGEWPKRVCDLGDQDLLCYSEADFDSLGVNSPRRGKAREFWRAVGADCMTLDVVGETTRFDLNTDKVPPEWGQFDLVTNAGDTEHVFNQVNCFTAIHDLTRVGGVMCHQLPVAGS